jgi:hypothetical protein
LQLQGVGTTPLVTVNATTVSGVAAMTAQQLREAGVTRGTRVTGGTADPVDVQETEQMVNTILAASNVSGRTLTDQMAAATQVFNAAGPTAVTGLSITIGAGQAGRYLISMAGSLQSSDAANAGCTAQIYKNGVAIGLRLEWGPAQFIGNNLKALGMGGLGLQLDDTAIVGDVYTVQIGVNPGGVGGDDITLSDGRLVAQRIN